MSTEHRCRLVAATYILGFVVPLASSQSLATSSQRTTLIVGARHVPPFAIRNADGTWSGISIELWQQIASDLGLEYEFTELSLEGLIDGLRTGSIDAAVAALTITAEREKAMDFTHPFHTSGLGIAISSKNKASWVAVIERFVSVAFLKVLLALVLVLAIAGLLVWFFERKRNVAQFGGDLPKGLEAGFWWSAVTMTTVGYGDKAPVTLGGRLVAMVWMFTSVIIISGFTAAITSSLTVTELELKVRGPEDLPQVRVAAIAGSTSEAYLSSKRIPYTTYDSAIDGLRAVAAGERDAIVYDSAILRYLIISEFDRTLRVLPQTFERQYYAIGLPENSEICESINRVLLQETGETQWQDVTKKYLGE